MSGRSGVVASLGFVAVSVAVPVAVSGAVSVAVPVAAAQAPAEPLEPDRARVRRWLTGVEAGPSLRQWRALGPQTLPILVSVYDDPAEAPFVRLRAVGACAAFSLPASRAFLLAVARAPEQSDLFIREAVVALGRAFGRDAIDDVRPFLSHERPVVREASGRILGHIGGRRASQALRAQAAVEEEPSVRRTLRDALRRAER